MLDQLFTAENFRRIYDLENRRGNDLIGRFFSELDPQTWEIKEKVQQLRELRALRGSLSEIDFERQSNVLKEELAVLKKKKSDTLDQLLDGVSRKVGLASFKIKLDQTIGPKGKTIYRVDDSPETFFVIKQLQVNLNKLYSVKQSNRHELVCQVRDILSSPFPHQIVRTDISSFYENIDRKFLVQKLENDQLLSSSSKRYIKDVLDSFGALAKTAVGIPRGVGISAYLAELYLRPLDKRIKEMDGITLYCRYVDDIVVVFSRPPIFSSSKKYDEQIETIFGEYGVSQNKQKTKYFDLTEKQIQPVKFEYLGYRFHLSKDSFTLAPSSTKIKKYRARLNATFDIYAKDRSVNPRRAYREIVSRLKFLTGNARLINSKSSAVVGVYYNNSLANTAKSFALLDKVLSKKILAIRSGSLRSRLKKFKFKEGFEKRTFHNFGTKEFKTIVEAWKHG